MIGIAGIDESPRIQIAAKGLGIALSSFANKMDDEEGAKPVQKSSRLGDRAYQSSFKSSFWFSDYSYSVKRNQAGGVSWREGRQLAFGKEERKIPFLLDSCGYRREISQTAPKWAHRFENYLAAIDLTQPDGFAAWDYPTDRQRSLEYLRRMQDLFPGDPRLWPIFSIRWTWNDRAHVSFSRAPKWAGKSLGYLIPTTRTQKKYSNDSRELWARQAIANAIAVANDRDFRQMAAKHGKVMFGGMVAGPCPRQARHLFFATLCHLVPNVQYWALGQANAQMINGLAQLELLERVYTDGSYWLKQSAAERIAIVESGLITEISLETPRGERVEGQKKRRESFFTFSEMCAANLRSLLSAYAGLIAWPRLEWPSDLPLSPLTNAQAEDIKPHYRMAQIELGL